MKDRNGIWPEKPGYTNALDYRANGLGLGRGLGVQYSPLVQ